MLRRLCHNILHRLLVIPVHSPGWFSPKTSSENQFPAGDGPRLDRDHMRTMAGGQRYQLRIGPHLAELVGRKYLDLLFHRPDTGRSTAVELKYLTALWSGQHAGEAFALRNHGAQDVNGYHIVNDLARLEAFCSGRDNWNGVLVLVTNDRAYWRAPTHGRATNAQAFRVHDGLELTGARAWGPSTGVGTMKGLESPIPLAGRYQLHWRDYSHLDNPRGQFRALVVEVNADRPSAAS
jgi:hypothetical protein